MKFYNIKDEYINFLKDLDEKVASNKSQKRPYIGIVLEIGEHKYYAPFSSPKPKHLNMHNMKDFRKISNGKLGAINFNNMIPVTDNALILIDIANIADKKYKSLLLDQLKAIRSDENQIKETARKLHELIFTSDEKLTKNDQIIKKRCCNLVFLESKYLEWKN